MCFLKVKSLLVNITSHTRLVFNFDLANFLEDEESIKIFTGNILLVYRYSVRTDMALLVSTKHSE